MLTFNLINIDWAYQAESALQADVYRGTLPKKLWGLCENDSLNEYL